MSSPAFDKRKAPEDGMKVLPPSNKRPKLVGSSVDGEVEANGHSSGASMAVPDVAATNDEERVVGAVAEVGDIAPMGDDAGDIQAGVVVAPSTATTASESTPAPQERLAEEEADGKDEESAEMEHQPTEGAKVPVKMEDDEESLGADDSERSEEEEEEEEGSSDDGDDDDASRDRKRTEIADYGRESDWLHVDDDRVRWEELDYEARARKREMDSAVASGLNPEIMSELELKHLPEFRNHHSFYLDLRNVILCAWQSNVTTYLTLKKATNQILTRYMPAATRVFGFLEQFGFINCGFLPLREPEDFDERVARSPRRRIIVVGAGASGLSAARQLALFGHEVVVVEGRDRIGGRVCTDQTTFSGPVDMGASIITGLGGNPITVICRQALQLGAGQRGSLDSLLHMISDDCQLYDVDGKPVEKELDQSAEEAFNRCLEGTDVLRAGYLRSVAMRKGKDPPPPAVVKDEALRKLQDLQLPQGKSLSSLTLHEGMMLVRDTVGMDLSEAELRVLYWHAANLEYGCAADLRDISVAHWDQDDIYGFKGQHCLVRQGYGPLIGKLADVLDVRLKHVVTTIDYKPADDGSGVAVTCMVDGEEKVIRGDTVLCTLPLGVLKHGDVKFNPPLPGWKTKAISDLGFGLLNKLVMEFDHAFWGDKVDMWGCVNKELERRGRFYMFWNLERSMGKPVLVALLAGKAAHDFELEDKEEARKDCVALLRSVFGADCPEPTQFYCTSWRSDPMTRGSYSYVHAGATGDEYDELARPVGERLFFAGEACNRMHPATVPGAYLSGLRIAGEVDNVGKMFKALDLSIAARDDEGLQHAHSNVHKALRPEDRIQLNLDESWLAGWKAKALKKRRGIRTAYEGVRDRQDATKLQQEQLERARRAKRIAEERRRLKSAAEDLLMGRLDPLAQLSRSAPVGSTSSNNGSGNISRHERAADVSSFSSKSVDLTGLPSLGAFDHFGGSDDDEIVVTYRSGDSKKDAHKSKKKSKKHKSKEHRRKESKSSKSSRSKDKSRSGSRKDKDRKGSSKSGKPNSARVKKELIAKYLRGVLKPHLATISKETFKTITKKATDKVHEDWLSKKRPSSLKLHTWLSHKRKAKIAALVESYVKKYGST